LQLNYRWRKGLQPSFALRIPTQLIAEFQLMIRNDPQSGSSFANYTIYDRVFPVAGQAKKPQILGWWAFPPKVGEECKYQKSNIKIVEFLNFDFCILIFDF
jgi:hypothetical protein